MDYDDEVVRAGTESRSANGIAWSSSSSSEPLVQQTACGSELDRIEARFLSRIEFREQRKGELCERPNAKAAGAGEAGLAKITDRPRWRGWLDRIQTDRYAGHDG